MKKQEKKFVLAALALLAITGLLALAGCKNDTVPEPTRYTVKFETDHGTAPADITVVSGAELTDKDLAIEPEVGDNIFEYWYDKDDDVQKPVEEGYTVTKDVTLVAKWRDRGTVASVTFTPPTSTKFYLGESIEVSLTSEDGATIQYKLDDGEWMDYTEETPISVTTITTITAKATKDGLKPSDETTATYTVRKLEGITRPARTVYSVGQSFDPTGMKVTATYDDGEERTVTGTITTDTSTLTQSAGVQTVTVRYSEGGIEVSGQFEIRVLPKELTDYKSPNNTDGSWTYVEFGEWPQTIKDDGVTVYKSEGKSKEMGMFICYLGSDDNYYVEAAENAYGDGTEYQYSNGDQAGRGGKSTKWFKVEPIVWRVLNKDYASTGNALLLAEKILTGGIAYYDDVVWDDRIVGEATIYPNNYEHSAVRAWLNGLKYLYKRPDGGGQVEKKDYFGKGFLQTAFTADAQSLIADTSVDISAASTNPASNPNLWSDGNNPYACANTTDKVFLLSLQEATNSEYGFGADGGRDSTRIRVTTDYAKATGAYQGASAGPGGGWWLRSPSDSEEVAQVINHNGIAAIGSSYSVSDADGGVVPALSISLQ